MPKILVVYYSRHGSIAKMAQHLAQGVDSVSNCDAVIRRVPEISANSEQIEAAVPAKGPTYASEEDLKNCDGLIMGSPAYFGNMSAALKYFLDQTSRLWLSGAMIGKPAAVFTSSSSLHGGQESVLLSMMLPLLHHGMIIAGIPYSEPSLHHTTSGATPYGASHVAGSQGKPLSQEEIDACHALGKRIAHLALKLTA
ncbi:MAG: NAD(P)H:quinone oxidoreductase [Gammaproteobacteria bacterium]|nr:NAD(P)H:quinone oxidoreductase [Gammaproteobacteria bacterium]